jgi:hypothetical protein
MVIGNRSQPGGAGGPVDDLVADSVAEGSEVLSQQGEIGIRGRSQVGRSRGVVHTQVTGGNFLGDLAEGPVEVSGELV